MFFVVCFVCSHLYHFILKGFCCRFFSGEGGDVGGEGGGVEFNDLNASRKPARMG